MKEIANRVMLSETQFITVSKIFDIAQDRTIFY